jgi:hypothetical protein
LAGLALGVGRAMTPPEVVATADRILSGIIGVEQFLEGLNQALSVCARPR